MFINKQLRYTLTYTTDNAGDMTTDPQPCQRGRPNTAAFIREDGPRERLQTKTDGRLNARPSAITRLRLSH